MGYSSEPEKKKAPNLCHRVTRGSGGKEFSFYLTWSSRGSSHSSHVTMERINNEIYLRLSIILSSNVIEYGVASGVTYTVGTAVAGQIEVDATVPDATGRQGRMVERRRWRRRQHDGRPRPMCFVFVSSRFSTATALQPMPSCGFQTK